MTSKSGLTRKVLRVLGRGPAIVACASLCLGECLLQAARRRLDTDSRSEILQRWSSRILSFVRVQICVSGPLPRKGLIVSNHLSYLDIWVLSAVSRCVFVSKREVRFWPVVGWVASLTGTVFVDRSRPSQTHSVKPQMQERLECGERLALFPEATSSDGRGILPFHSSLFEAAVTAAAPITAVHISYELPGGDGDPATDVCYWGDMVLLPHLLKLLTKTNVRATLSFAEAPRVFLERKQAAAETQAEVERLGDAKSGSAARQQSRAAHGFGENFAAN